MQNPIISLEVENLAWHGTRLQIKDEKIFTQYGLSMELGWHAGKKQYMNTIYYFDIHHKCFPYAHALIAHENVFAPTIKECLEDSEHLINIFYSGIIAFEFSTDQSNWIKKAY